MATEEQIRATLAQVIVPQAERSLVQLNLVQEIKIEQGKVSVRLAAAGLAPDVQEYITAGVRAVLSKARVKNVDVEYTEAKAADLNKVKRVIAIMSGKGGVGKSAVACLTAISLRRRDLEVGILDADITGSSIPHMFGINTRPLGSETGIIPVATESGIAIMSMNLLIPQEENAVIWRAPLLTRAITQFWEEVLWGNLDYLIIDLPPGTADAPLTVLQTIPVMAVVLVFTPQGLVEMIVKKAVDMARKMEKPVLGVVENMSYFRAPETGKTYELFGPSKAEAMAVATGAPLLARLPIDPDLARLCDDGKIEDYTSPAIDELGDALMAAVEKQAGKVK